MPILHISVYSHAVRAQGGPMPMPQAPALFEYGVPITLESKQCPPFPNEAVFVMVKPDVACCLAFGPDPTAENGVHPVEANERMWYGISPGHQIAVIEHLK